MRLKSAASALDEAIRDDGGFLLPKTIRRRSKAHLALVRSRPCCIPGCPNKLADAHHLTHAQLKARGLKVSDEYTVPLCVVHHSAGSQWGVHFTGDEREWWRFFNVDPFPIALRLWQESERKRNKTNA